MHLRVKECLVLVRQETPTNGFYAFELFLRRSGWMSCTAQGAVRVEGIYRRDLSGDDESGDKVGLISLTVGLLRAPWHDRHRRFSWNSCELMRLCN